MLGENTEDFPVPLARRGTRTNCVCDANSRLAISKAVARRRRWGETRAEQLHLSLYTYGRFAMFSGDSGQRNPMLRTRKGGRLHPTFSTGLVDVLEFNVTRPAEKPVEMCGNLFG
jgi:hypothetical protein